MSVFVLGAAFICPICRGMPGNFSIFWEIPCCFAFAQIFSFGVLALVFTKKENFWRNSLWIWGLVLWALLILGLSIWLGPYVTLYVETDPSIIFQNSWIVALLSFLTFPLVILTEYLVNDVETDIFIARYRKHHPSAGPIDRDLLKEIVLFDNLMIAQALWLIPWAFATSSVPVWECLPKGIIVPFFGTGALMCLFLVFFQIQKLPKNLRKEKFRIILWSAVYYGVSALSDLFHLWPHNFFCSQVGPYLFLGLFIPGGLLLFLAALIQAILDLKNPCPKGPAEPAQVNLPEEVGPTK
jgi:hypothetical protein